MNEIFLLKLGEIVLKGIRSSSKTSCVRMCAAG